MTAGDLKKEKIQKKDGRYLYLYSWSRGGLDDEKADPRKLRRWTVEQQQRAR